MSDQANTFTPRDLEIHAAKRLHGTKGFGGIPDLKQDFRN
jgi:hypothetical protein